MIIGHKSFMVRINPAPKQGDLSVLFSGKARPKPGLRNGPAIHDYFLIHTVIGGAGWFELAGKQYQCTEGDSFIIFPGMVFLYEPSVDTPWYYCWVAFTGDNAAKQLEELGITPERPVISTTNVVKMQNIYKRMRDGLDMEHAPSLIDLEASGLLRLLIYELGLANREFMPKEENPLSDQERQLDQAIRWLFLQYTQSITIEQLAKSLGYHRTHLSRIFKQRTGQSPAQYLLKIRMEKAKELLGRSLSITEVAASVGYSDPLYFSRQFRKWTGESPTDYRQRTYPAAGTARL
ncbi:MAG: AraC family transcriptional regulator [Gorillibacterium sp.]|nr:AraC family transcriptional regulator [Gorillibacterium sp.]